MFRTGWHFPVPFIKNYISRLLFASTCRTARLEQIVFIDIESMTGSGSPVLIENLFSLIAGKNISLVRKLKYMTCPTIREKLMAYLSDEAEKHGSEEFLIPFSREELASFLSVDRCALSRELGKMRDDGLLEFRRNRFHLSENRG